MREGLFFLVVKENDRGRARNPRDEEAEKTHTLIFGEEAVCNFTQFSSKWWHGTRPVCVISLGDNIIIDF